MSKKYESIKGNDADPDCLDGSHDLSDKQPPYARAGFFGQIFVFWIAPLLSKIYNNDFDSERDLWACAVRDRSEINSTTLERMWKEEVMTRGEEKASILKIVWRYGKGTFILLIVFNFISSLLLFISSSFCVNFLLKFADGDIEGTDIGVMLVIAMAVTVLGRLVTTAYLLAQSIFMSTRLRNAIMAMLYKKCLKIKDLSDDTVGKLINTLSTDGERIQRGIVLSFALFGAPILLVAGTTYACIVVGPMALLALSIFISQFVTVILLAKKLGSLRVKAAAVADKRLKSISELLTCMKIIKVYTWENSFMEKIFNIRGKEKKILFFMRVLQSLMLMSSSYALAFAQVVTIVASILVLGVITPVEAFTLITVLNTMKVGMDVMPNSLRGVADVLVAFKRMKEVMLMEEFRPPAQITEPSEKIRYCVTFNQTTFAYKVECTSQDDEPNGNKVKNVKSKLKEDKKIGYGALKPSDDMNGGVVSDTTQLMSEDGYVNIPSLVNLNFGLPKGKLIGICGSIGSGKTSLLQAILGRVEATCGSFAVNGSVAYVAQEAWLNNATVRENILFGNKFNKAKYERCLDVCCLKDDLDILSAGDHTEVGERGINLSGGQKQRISLARAVYSDRDLYLLDDPLSAVDNRVGSRIFTECIKRALEGKSVLLVTHQVRFLSKCDEVMFMKSTGLMANHTHDDLMRIDAQYREMINSVEADSDKDKKQEGEEKPPSEKQPLAQPDDKTKDTSDGKLTGKEMSVKGTLSWSVLGAYLKASGGYLTGVVLVFFVFLNVASQAFPAWWISVWLEKDFPPIEPNCTQHCETIDIREDPFFVHNLLTYGASPILILIFGFSAAFIIAKITYTASTNFHNSLIRKVCMATMTFFDTTPVGQIQNRFTSDMDQMDSFLSTNLELLLYYALLVLIILATVIISSPIVTATIVPSAIIFFFIWVRTRPSVRDLKRVENVARSPQYSLITSTIKGLTTVTAFEKTNNFTDKFCGILDRFHVRLVCFQFVSRWAAIRLDLVVWLIIVSISTVIVAIPNEKAAAQSGLALSFALQLSSILYIIVMFTNEVIASFTSVERVDDYIKNVPQEAPAIHINQRPEQSWPEYGQIMFFDFCLRYQPHLPRVLNKVTFRVDPMERVGIVGRTGAGKSSITTALFRLVEKESGSIFIDGVDISTIGLRDLRRHVSLVPQDPVLFSGTIRSNVDPFSDRKDAEIWEALGKVNMKNKISGMPGLLEEKVSDGGSNFSLGERQLICMARAILSRSRILLMDEATASVDPQTDALIQDAIRTSFPECTMLIIAHRLNTVLDCDKILVMDKGEVAEFDSPSRLLENKDSIFKQLLAASAK